MHGERRALLIYSFSLQAPQHCANVRLCDPGARSEWGKRAQQAGLLLYSLCRRTALGNAPPRTLHYACRWRTPPAASGQEQKYGLCSRCVWSAGGRLRAACAADSGVDPCA